MGRQSWVYFSLDSFSCYCIQGLLGIFAEYSLSFVRSVFVPTTTEVPSTKGKKETSDVAVQAYY